MRLLQAFEPPEGGVRMHVSELTRGLIQRGHQVDVVVSRDREVAEAFERIGARVIPVDLVPGIFDHRENLRAFLQLRRILKQGGYDLVHLHDSKAGAVGRPAALLTRTPVVYTPHEMVYMSQHLRERRGAGPRRALTLGVERTLGPMAQAIVCVTERERSAALADRVGRSERVETVHNGVRRPSEIAADPRLKRLRGEGPLIGYLGRLHQGKGLEDLVRALQLLHAEGSVAPVAIVGNGPLHDDLATQLDRAGLGDLVELRSFDGEPWPYVAAFDMLAVPSHFDALPLVILEAMAVGLPVVATTVGGIPEGVEDEVTGLLVPPGDPSKLASAIGRLVDDAGLRKRLGDAARRRYEERFTSDRMVDAIERIYARVLAQR